MKVLIKVILIILTLSSCTKSLKGEEEPLFAQDVIFSDSFSPASYESPASRKIINVGDTDLGAFISSDSNEPMQNNLFSSRQAFVTIKNKKPIEELFSDACYNSFILRYPKYYFSETYQLRIAVPQISFDAPFAVNYKLILPKRKILGTLELSKHEESYLISDYTSEGFDFLLGN